MEPGFETTERGALLGHVALGLLMLDRRFPRRPSRPAPSDELCSFQHLIGSHHGKLEFGATAPPMTLEAEILHFADDASAKIRQHGLRRSRTRRTSRLGRYSATEPCGSSTGGGSYRGRSDWGVSWRWSRKKRTAA